MFKSGKELEKVKRIIAKYGNKKKQEEYAAQEKAVFGEAQIMESNDETTCSSSEENDEESQELVFTLEEIKMLDHADKLAYMEKLQGDYKIIQEKIEETIENVIVARNEAKESIAKGEETLANFRQYQKRVDNMVNKMCINMGYDDKKDRRRVTKLGE